MSQHHHAWSLCELQCRHHQHHKRQHPHRLQSPQLEACSEKPIKLNSMRLESVMKILSNVLVGPFRPESKSPRKPGFAPNAHALDAVRARCHWLPGNQYSQAPLARASHQVAGTMSKISLLCPPILQLTGAQHLHQVFVSPQNYCASGS